jgi:hypothetical protein
MYRSVKAELDHNNSETFGGKIQTHRSKTLYPLYWLNQAAGASIHYPIKASGDHFTAFASCNSFSLL